jgi:hypothetical protein
VSRGAPGSDLDTDGQALSYTLRLPHPAGIKTSIDLSYRSSNGDLVDVTWDRRGIVVHPNSGLITGYSAPGKTLVVHALDRRGHLIASGLAGASPSTGAFQSFLTRRDGRPAPLAASDMITLSDGQAASRFTVPTLDVRLVQDVGLRGWTNQRRDVTVSLLQDGKVEWEATVAVRHSRFSISFANPFDFVARTQVQILAGSSASGALEVDIPLNGPARLGGAAAWALAHL